MPLKGKKDYASDAPLTRPASSATRELLTKPGSPATHALLRKQGKEDSHDPFDYTIRPLSSLPEEFQKNVEAAKHVLVPLDQVLWEVIKEGTFEEVKAERDKLLKK